MRVIPLNKYIIKLEGLVDRKAKQVRNSDPSDFKSSRQLDYYRSHLVSMRYLQKRGEDYYIKF